MIVVTTPTGHIGSQVVQSLLAANEAVRVIARQPDRIAQKYGPKWRSCRGRATTKAS